MNNIRRTMRVINEEGKEKALETLNEGQVRDAYRFIFNDWAPPPIYKRRCNKFFTKA